MMLYSQVRENDMEPESFIVLETLTGHSIKAGLCSEKANRLIHHLSGGGGFSGWTPKFIIKPIIRNQLEQNNAI